MKKKLQKIGRQIWELFKGSLLMTVMYACAGSILMMLATRGSKEIIWDGGKIAWTVVCIVGAAAYQALASWANGGSQYEMLVSGNVRRSTVDAYGNAYKMSSHKEAKEYRPWKGFVIGGFVAIVPIIFALIFGGKEGIIHGDNMPKGLAIFLLIGFFLSGWSVVPFYCMNEAGIAVSYFWGLPFAIIPVIVGGGFYIAGAYARRNKALRLQQLEDAAAAAEAARQANKKINYGGLPGTKPKKRK